MSHAGDREGYGQGDDDEDDPVASVDGARLHNPDLGLDQVPDGDESVLAALRHDMNAAHSVSAHSGRMADEQFEHAKACLSDDRCTCLEEVRSHVRLAQPIQSWMLTLHGNSCTDLSLVGRIYTCEQILLH